MGYKLKLNHFNYKLVNKKIRDPAVIFMYMYRFDIIRNMITTRV